MVARDAGAFIHEAIESIRNQTFRDFELVVVDDGSRDDSADKASALASVDHRITVIRRKASGIPESRNAGLSACAGDLLAIMDADDVSEPTRLEEQVAFLSRHPNVVAVGCQVLWVDPEGMPLRRNWHPLSHSDITKELLDGAGWAIQHGTALMRREAVVTAGGYSTGLLGAEDLDLFLRLGELGELANLPEVLYRYRQHRASVTHAQRERLCADHLSVVERAMKRRGGAPLEPRVRFARRRLTAAEQHRTWGWWALEGGNVGTARKHAVRCLVRTPWSVEAWRLAVCAWRGR